MINETQEVILRNLIFQVEVVEQRPGARLLTHHQRLPPCRAE